VCVCVCMSVCITQQGNAFVCEMMGYLKKAFRKTARFLKCLISTFYLITILCDIRFECNMCDEQIL